MEPRLATSVLVGALLRKAEADGGFGAVIAKGDSTAGSILLLLTERGVNSTAYERVLESSGRYVWSPLTSQVIGKAEEVPQLVARRRRFDPDLWIIELDIPSIERFAAGMDGFG